MSLFRFIFGKKQGCEYYSNAPCYEDITSFYNQDDVKYFLRDLNLEVAIGNLDLTPDIERLSPKLVNKCRKLSDMGMIIGGSTLLRACGLLNRKTGDIDVLYDIDTAKKEGIIKNWNIINSSNDSYHSWKTNKMIEESGRTKRRVKVKYGWFKSLDVFDVPKEFSERFVVRDGIRWGDVMVTLEEKLRYGRDKDATDFHNIKRCVEYLKKN